MSESMGSIIRRLRKERGLTQEELAELLGVTFQAISKWETDMGMPDISMVVPLSNVLGVTTDTLFGTETADVDMEIEDFIVGIEHKICNGPDDGELEYYLGCVEEVSEKLKEYPSNYRLLSYSLGVLYSAIDELGSAGRNDEAKPLMSEFIRRGNIVLSHCTDADTLNITNHWFVYFYIHIGENDKAEEHAGRISRNFIYSNSRSMLAYVKGRKGDSEEAMKLRGEVILSALMLLTHELGTIGNQYARMDKLEEAYQCYALFPDIYDLIIKDREDDIPFYRDQSYDRLAITCMKLGRYDEAIEQLERYLRHEKKVAETYNIITESKIPYFFGGNLKFSHDHYTTRGEISETIELEIFNPIRDTDRFRTLAKEVSEFEEKYRI